VKSGCLTGDDENRDDLEVKKERAVGVGGKNEK